MSDEKPPSSEPTPIPEDGTEPVAQPTPAEEQPTPAEEGTYAESTPAAASTSRRNPVIIAVAALLVLVLVAGAAFAAVKLLGGSDSHKLGTPATAGKMKRDTTKEKSLAQQLTLAQKQFKTQVGGSAAYYKRAIYNQTDSSRGPSGGVVFFGAKLTEKQIKAQTPTQWIAKNFTKQATANGLKVVNVSAGDGDAKAACASIVTPQKIAICAWRTKDSIGELIPTVPGYESAGMAKLMRDVRADVETSE
jgi:hypothetical protein